MVSINTAASNSAVLTSLRQTNRDLTMTQSRIGTGLKVASASDNPSVWATAQGIRSDVKAQDTISAGINTAKSKADTAVGAMNTISDLLGKIKVIADAAASSGTGTTAQVSQVTSLQKQIAAVAASANFGGDNWLTTASATESVKVGVSSGASNSLDLTTTDLDADTDFIAAAVTATSTTDILTLSAEVDAALGVVATYTGTLAGYSSALDSQIDFLSTLKTIREAAVSSLVDADLEEESAKLSALQVKQQLAYQALSIGNASSQNILRLFQ